MQARQARQARKTSSFSERIRPGVRAGILRRAASHGRAMRLSRADGRRAAGKPRCSWNRPTEMLLGGLLLLCLACQPTSPPSPSSQNSQAADNLWSDSASLSERAETILALRDGIERARLFATLLRAAQPADIDSIVEALENSSRDYGDVELTLFGEWWASFDPTAAFEWTETHWQAEHPRVISNVVRTWARQDPQAAYKYGYSNRRLSGSPFFRTELTTAVVVGWVESGEPGVLEFAVGLRDTATVQRAFRALGRITVATRGTAQALAWARDVDDLDEANKRHLILNFVSAAADQDPLLTVEFASSLQASGRGYSQLMPRIGRRWARHEPLAAITWAEHLEDPDQRAATLLDITSEWFSNDEDAAGRWVEAQGIQPWLEPAIRMYVQNKIRRAGPDENWQALIEDWTLAVSKDQERWGLTTMVLQRWVVHDENASFAWIDTHTDALPSEYREKAKSPPEQNRVRFLRQSARNAARREAS